jgi:hypothetical protein
MTGRVDGVIRASVSPGELLAMPTGRGHFTVARYTSEGLALLLGKKEAWTPLPWRAMDGVPEFLRGRGWVAVGGVYSTDGVPGSLDEYLKAYLNRATAGWVAVLRLIWAPTAIPHSLNLQTIGVIGALATGDDVE